MEQLPGLRILKIGDDFCERDNDKCLREPVAADYLVIKNNKVNIDGPRSVFIIRSPAAKARFDGVNGFRFQMLL